MTRTSHLAFMFVLAAAITGALASPAAAREEDWAALLPPAALATHLDGSSRDLLVVGVGPARGAAEILRGALRATGRLHSVMLTGAPPSLDDRALIARGEAAGADTLAVVRLADDTLMVTLYDRTGASLGGFSVEAGGRPLAPRAGGRTGGARGVSASAATAVEGVLRDRPSPRAPLDGNGNGGLGTPAEEQYAREHLGLFNVTGYSAQTGVVLATWIQPYQGVYKQPIPVGTFYDKVDPVRGAAYRSAVKKRIAVAASGGGGILLGLSLALAGIAPKDPTARNALFGLGGSIGIAGIALLCAAPFIRVPSMDVYEAVRLVDKYNAQLRSRLGLSVTDVRVSANSDGASFGITGSF